MLAANVMVNAEIHMEAYSPGIVGVLVLCASWSNGCLRVQRDASA
jgi:hypothetical protein